MTAVHGIKIINDKGGIKLANLQKYSAMEDIGHLCAHYERSVPNGHYSNNDIQEDRIMDDYNLAPERGVQTEYIKGKIKEITTEKKIEERCCTHGMLDRQCTVFVTGRKKNRIF